MNRFKIVAALLPLFFSCTYYDQGAPAESVNTAFVSVPLGDENFGEYHVAAAYYPLHGNIDNQKSPAFVDTAPTPEQTLTASIDVPSYSWTIVKGVSAMRTITLMEHYDGWKSRWTWYVVDEWRNTSNEFPAHFGGQKSDQLTGPLTGGQLPEHRYRELTNPESLYSPNLLYADTEITARIGTSEYAVIPYNRILHRLHEFIREQQLHDPGVDIRYGRASPGQGASRSPIAAKPSPPRAAAGITTPIVKPAAPSDPFAVKGKALDSAAHACLANLYADQALMTRNHVHCHTDETIRVTLEGDEAKARVRQVTHDIQALPSRSRDFTFALFPGFQPHDTFSLTDETARTFTFTVSSSNPVFREFLRNVVLHFDRSTGTLTELSATALPPMEEIGTMRLAIKEPAVPAPLTIRYKLQGAVVLPFESSFTQELKQEGKSMTAVHDMTYRY